MRILVTGATGFVGKALLRGLQKKNLETVVSVRSQCEDIPETVKQYHVNNINAHTDWSDVLNKVDVVIHLAARVHVMNDGVNSSDEYRNVNTLATLNLARQAVASGVKRFVFLSSIKVNGESTEFDQPFTSDGLCTSVDPYALSKHEAELGLLKLAHETGMEVVIIRPPLVYGPEVKANFASMMKWVNKGIPLPFGAVHNKRSLVALENLVSFIIHCIDHPKAANEIFLISDGEDVSTTELLQKVARALGKKSRLVPVPVSWMQFVAKCVGKETVSNRLFGSLQVDSAKARKLLGWKPVITMDEQLKKTADAFLESESSAF